MSEGCNDKAQQSQLVVVGCPWQAIRMLDGRIRCEAFIRWSVNQGDCAGDRCEQYVAWKKVFNGNETK